MSQRSLISSQKPYISWLGSIYFQSNKNELMECIHSIEWQECDYAQEIVLVKDGLINKDIEIFLKNYNFKINFKLININENGGLGNALKIGSQNCEGEYIVRFDTDDISLPNRLSTQIPLLEKDSELAFISSGVYEKDKSDNFFYKLPYKKSAKDLIYKLNPVNHPTVVLNKEILFSVGNYESVHFFEDYYLWLKFIKKGYKYKLISNPLVIMKVDESYSKRWGIKYAFCEIIFFNKLIKENIINPRYTKYFLLRILSRLVLIPYFQKKIRNNRRVLKEIKMPLF